MSNRLTRRISDTRQRDMAAIVRRVGQALAAGDISRAATLADKALTAGQINPMLLNLAAWRREEAEDYAGAHHLLKHALALAPGDVMILGAIGAVLRKERRLDESLAVLDQAIAAEPRHAAAWLERGYVLDAMQADVAAAESYRRALALDASLSPALGKLADGCAKRGEKEDARRLAAEALTISPHEPAATCAIATLEIEVADGAAAEVRLRALLAQSLSKDDRTRALTLLGDALDRQNRTREAFATYREAQHNFRAAYASVLAPNSKRPSHRSFIEHIAAQVAATPEPPRHYPPIAIDEAASEHVFLLGYPRSGTTLVENVLASAPNVVALEERDTFFDVDHRLIADDGTMPPLDALDGDLVDMLRSAYWRRVRALAGSVTDRIFVDMNPFNGIKLPLIARLFPAARIVIMRRDPRDVVLSCFRINFAPGPAAWAFADLEETARHYDALTGLIELARERLPLAYHELRYDRLVTDFEPTVRALADFVGLGWTDAFRSFDRTARTRGVRTASATQIRRGLYDGRGQWRRYEAELAPVMPLLTPWVQRFGFDT